MSASKDVAIIDYEKWTFYIDAPTPNDYSKFLENLRNTLKVSTLEKYKLRILHSESDTHGNVYCYADISYDSNILTLAFDVVNMNLLAFESKSKSESTAYFFNNTKGNDIFHGKPKVVMPFMNTYPSLGDRTAVNLGINALQNAFNVLTHYKQHVDDLSVVKTSIINVMGMVLEATRFKLIEDDVKEYFDKDIPSDIVINSYEDNWAILSEYIINAKKNGDFPDGNTVYVNNLDGTTRALTNVADVKAKMGILKYYPRTEPN